MDPQPTPAGPPALETVSGSDLAGELLKLPPSPASAPDLAATATQSASAAPSDVPVDSLGRRFDPVRFRTVKETGKPFLNFSGQFMPKGGRPKGGQTRFPKSVMQPPPPEPAGAPAPARQTFVPPPPTAQPVTDQGAAASGPSQPAPAAPGAAEIIELTAEGYLRAGYAVADTLLDARGEWQPDNDSEHAALRASAVAYLKTNQGEPLSPGAAFLVSAGVYCFKRISRSRTASALRFIWAKMSGKPTAQPPANPPPKTAPAATAAAPAEPPQTGGIQMPTL